MSNCHTLIHRLIIAAFIAMAMGILSTNVWAQAYPTKPIRLIVPFSPGGGTDLFGRITAARLTQALGQQVVVENRAGAGGNIGMEIAAKSDPDGYTLLLGHTGTLAINPALYTKIPYDPVRDFSPVSLVAYSPLVLVTHPSLPARTVKELIALAKSKRGQINYASGGSGTGTHLSAELFKSMAGVDIVHVPYKGSGPAVIALLSGEVSILFTPVAAAVVYAKGGRLRALGVTGAVRSIALRDVPTIAEAGLPGYESSLRYGVLTPARAPQNVINTLNQAINRSMGSAEVREQLASDGAEPLVSTPNEFRTLIQSEIKKWAAVVKASGARVD
ncbi:MAG: tripartite tricarboxylate transporter substrate binding protein [Betaproteobacteria bacterium]|nr:tripartite tricarboxylate transporter substrate binding protein [Betaproteobacteria bacterium]